MDSVTDMENILEIVRCPRTGQKLHQDKDCLVTEDGAWTYRVEGGIPVLLAEEAKGISKS
jgi:uncharacterized protein YbaR (Trm112 family)